MDVDKYREKMWKNTKNKGKKTAEHKKICYNIEK